MINERKKFSLDNQELVAEFPDICENYIWQNTTSIISCKILNFAKPKNIENESKNNEKQNSQKLLKE